MSSVIGIDVSKEKLDICLIINDKAKFKIYENTQKGFYSLLKWIEFKCGPEKPKICMEATGTYMEELAEFMHDAGFEVSIVNPMQIKSFSKSKLLRAKNDKSDSELIARFCLLNNPRIWVPQRQELRKLREISRLIKSLTEESVRMRNKLESRLISEAAKSAILDIVSSIDSQILKLKSEMKKIVKEDKEISNVVNAFDEIKGVGFLTACAVISGMPDVKNFSNAKEYAAFIGITPTVFESGSSVKKHSKISKIGDKHIRGILYMSAVSAKNHNKHFSDFVQRLEKKGKKPKVIFCAVMRKLMHIFFGMLKNNSTFDKNLAFGS